MNTFAIWNKLGCFSCLFFFLMLDVPMTVEKSSDKSFLTLEVIMGWSYDFGKYCEVILWSWKIMYDFMILENFVGWPYGPRRYYWLVFRSIMTQIRDMMTPEITYDDFMALAKFVRWLYDPSKYYRMVCSFIMIQSWDAMTLWL